MSGSRICVGELVLLATFFNQVILAVRKPGNLELAHRRLETTTIQIWSSRKNHNQPMRTTHLQQRLLHMSNIVHSANHVMLKQHHCCVSFVQSQQHKDLMQFTLCEWSISLGSSTIAPGLCLHNSFLQFVDQDRLSWVSCLMFLIPLLHCGLCKEMRK